jgi:cysteine desulfurase
MQPFLTDHYGNPSSAHWAALSARDAIERARGQVASLLASDPTEIVFTSGGTEANNMALKGVFFVKQGEVAKPHFITSSVEHPAVLEPLRFLETLGASATVLPVDRYGQVDPNDVRRAIRPNTVLISVMHANNEVGTIEPIPQIAAIARENGVFLHTDAAQTVGKLPVDVDALRVNLLSIAGHKLYGPKGVGALFIREGIDLVPLLHGASHEAGRRAGTENVPQIVGLGAACELAHSWTEGNTTVRLRDHLWQVLQDRFGDRVVLNGHPSERLPNTLNVGFRGEIGSELLARIPNIAASTGSACHAGSMQMSPVLQAMGVPVDVGLGAVRFSLGRYTTHADIQEVLEMLDPNRTRRTATTALSAD